MMPGTEFINITFVLGQVTLSAFLVGNFIIAPACLVYVCFLASFIVKMVRNRLEQLRAEQRASQLLSEVRETSELLRVANEKLAATAFEDPLTGLANRRKFDLAIVEAVAHARSHRTNLSLMMIDVDHFKFFNDTYGHPAGDQCLQVVSQAIRSAVPAEGVVARYGGEEFVVLLPGHDQANALLAAEQARLAVESTELSNLPNSPPGQTISIGLISSCADAHLTPKDLIAGADAALYEAKRNGRNRVTLDRICSK